AELAQSCGLDGIVASPREAARVRERLGPGLLLVTPGVPPRAWPADDQARTAPPREALAAGPDLPRARRPVPRAPHPAPPAPARARSSPRSKRPWAPRPRDPRAVPDRQELAGLHCAREALRARRRALHRLRVRAGDARPALAELAALAATAGVPVEEVAADELARAAGPGVAHQGAVLSCGPLLEGAPAEPAGAEGGPARSLVALDGVEDPQNLGAIARVAEAAGASGLVLTQRRAAPLGPAVARASAGAIEWLPVARVVNL